MDGKLESSLFVEDQQEVARADDSYPLKAAQRLQRPVPSYQYVGSGADGCREYMVVIGIWRSSFDNRRQFHPCCVAIKQSQHRLPLCRRAALLEVGLLKCSVKLNA